jgi:hypothetical protein
LFERVWVREQAAKPEAAGREGERGGKWG